MTSIRQLQMRWECNREIRQTHEKECAFFMRTNSCLPNSTGGNRANGGSNPAPFPPLAPVRLASLTARTCQEQPDADRMYGGVGAGRSILPATRFGLVCRVGCLHTKRAKGPSCFRFHFFPGKPAKVRPPGPVRACRAKLCDLFQPLAARQAMHESEVVSYPHVRRKDVAVHWGLVPPRRRPTADEHVYPAVKCPT